MMKASVYIAILASLALAGACRKERVEPRPQSTVVQISVRSESGTPLGGVQVLIYDEAGYERFRENRNTAPAEIATTSADGTALWRFVPERWSAERGPRVIHFVIYDRVDAGNYRIWAVGRTLGMSATEQIRFEIDTATAPEPADAALVDLYDEANGHTLFAGAAYLDAQRRFNGGDRYSFVDAGEVPGLKALGEATVEGFADRIAIHPGHGYFMYKDISLMEFPSGKWGVATATEYATIYVEAWIYRGEEIAGARIRYSKHKPAEGLLPEWGQQYEVRSSGDRSVTIRLPAAAGSCEFATRGKDDLRFEAGPDQMTVRVTDPLAAAGKEYRLYIRSGSYYTETKIRIMD